MPTHCKVAFCGLSECDLVSVTAKSLTTCYAFYSEIPRVSSCCVYLPSATQHVAGLPCRFLQPCLAGCLLPFQICRESLLNQKSVCFEFPFLFSDFAFFRISVFVCLFVCFLPASFNFWAAFGCCILTYRWYARAHAISERTWGTQASPWPYF